MIKYSDNSTVANTNTLKIFQINNLSQYSCIYFYFEELKQNGSNNQNMYFNAYNIDDEIIENKLINLIKGILFKLDLPDGCEYIKFSVFNQGDSTNSHEWYVCTYNSNNLNSIKGITNIIKTEKDLTFTSGYITNTGAIHPTTNMKNYYSNMIYPISKVSIVPNTVSQQLQFSVCKYDKNGFVERIDWQQDSIILNNEYSYIINIALTRNVTDDIPLEILLENINIFYLDYDLAGLESAYDIINNLITTTTTIIIPMKLGLVTNTSSTTRIMMKNVLPQLTTDQTISLINDAAYKFAVYYNNNSLEGTEAGWKSLPFTPSINLVDVNICICKIDNSAFDLSVDSDNLLDYVTITNLDKTEYHLTDNEISYIKKNLDISGTFKSKWNGKKAAFIGDSITYGAGTSSGNIYYNFINTTIEFDDIYVNAISGRCWSATSDYANAKTPIATAASSIPTDRDLIVIFAGTNDFGHNTPMGSIDDTTDVSFYGAMYQAITTIINNNVDVRIVLLTPLHRVSGTYSELVKNGQDLYLSDYVDAIKNFASVHSIPVIDLYNISGLDPKIPIINSTYFSDGLHPNAAGHEKLGDIIDNYLEFV